MEQKAELCVSLSLVHVCVGMTCGVCLCLAVIGPEGWRQTWKRSGIALVEEI